MSMLIRAADIWTCEAVELGEWMLSSCQLYFAPCRYVCIYVSTNSEERLLNLDKYLIYDLLE